MADLDSDKLPEPGPLGEFIKEQRLAKRWSQRNLAEEAGVSNGYVANLERGFDYATRKPVKPSVDKLHALANGLGVDPNILLSLATGATLEQARERSELARLDKRFRGRLPATVGEVLAQYSKATASFASPEDAIRWLQKRSMNYVLEFIGPLAENNQRTVSYWADLLFQELLDTVQLPSYPGTAETPLAHTEDQDNRQARRYGLGPIPIKLRIPPDTLDPPDEWELQVLDRIGIYDYGELDPRRDYMFWYESKDARRRILRTLEDLWFERKARIERRTLIERKKRDVSR